MEVWSLIWKQDRKLKIDRQCSELRCNISQGNKVLGLYIWNMTLEREN